MFEVKEKHLVSNQEKLLYNIWQELKKLNEAAPDPAQPMRKAAKEKVPFCRKCAKCGEEFDNYGKYMGHMKEHKDKGE